MSFKSWDSYREFSRSVHSKYRYILDGDAKAFLNSIIDTCEERTETLKKGNILWRAQNGYDLQPVYEVDPNTGEEIHIDDFVSPYSSKRMKPLADSAAEGRANPKGLPCLYVATDKETAMSEVRPWLNAIISVAYLKVSRDLKIIVFATDDIIDPPFYFSNPSEDKIIKSVWSYIDYAFSTPTKISDLKSDYVPTQIISEFIKSKGYDGIAYRSSLGSGLNIALFDLESASIEKCITFRASKINFEFKHVQEP